jgi:hypothetical protein
MKVGKAHLKIEIIQQNSTRKSFTEFGYRNLIKLLRSLGPKLKLKSMMWQTNGYEAYSELFKKKLVCRRICIMYADLLQKKRMIILHRKNQL